MPICFHMAIDTLRAWRKRRSIFGCRPLCPGGPPADKNGWPIGVDTLLLRRVGAGCEPVIRIVKEPWRLSPVAFRCLSTASVLHFEEHFRGKDLAAGALCWDDLIKVEHVCREL